MTDELSGAADLARELSRQLWEMEPQRLRTWREAERAFLESPSEETRLALLSEAAEAFGRSGPAYVAADSKSREILAARITETIARARRASASKTADLAGEAIALGGLDQVLATIEDETEDGAFRALLIVGALEAVSVETARRIIVSASLSESPRVRAQAALCADRCESNEIRRRVFEKLVLDPDEAVRIAAECAPHACYPTRKFSGAVVCGECGKPMPGDVRDLVG